MKRRAFASVLACLALTFATSPTHAVQRRRRPPARKSKAKAKSKGKGKAQNRDVREPEGDWQELWNGRDLTGWRTNLPPAAGGNVDGQPTEVFSVVQQSGKPLLRISGHRFGTLISDASFHNYQLRMEWRWGVDKWAPRAHLRRSSGIVLHALAPPKVFGSGKPWPSGLELELQEGSCGDLVVGDGVRVDVPARRERFMGKPLYVFAAAQPPQTLPQADAEPRVVKSNDYERGYGEWNVVDAYLCEQDGAFVINGALALRFQNIRQLEGEAETPLVEGPVQISSEGAELFVRRIAVRSLDKIPDRFGRHKARR